MRREIMILIVVVIVLVLGAFILYQYGVAAGTAAGAAGVSAVAIAYRKRGQEEQRVTEVVEDAKTDAAEIRENAEEAIKVAVETAKESKNLAADVDSIT